ncbi:SpoIIE family protein phosphatase [Actinoplanes sp. NPDC026619]|uniref:SpoIIE family protein phosphatase n=1 Tax=Actinoplanes sp. NPDC026619 TaxID=3155798 RepID=UPI0033CA19A4
MSDDSRRLLAALDQVPFILVVCEGPELLVRWLSGPTRAVLPGRPTVGVPIRDMISDLIGQQFVDAYYEVYRTGVPVTGQEWRAHLDMPDGSVHEMYANFTISPWFSAMNDTTDKPDGVIGVGFDVTEMVRRRQAAELLEQRYQETRQVITALQRELLPAGLPVLPGLQVAASYLLADADTAAGGDWFDVVPQRDGRVALIAGDVVGHGVAASGVMGQLRAVLRDRLDDGAGIIEALSAADRFASRSLGAHATTICMAVLDPVTGELAYCTAGHPAPLLVTPGGPTRYLRSTGGKPLATGGSFPIGTDRVRPGELLLLYTDGILERPGRDHVSGAAELAQVAADSAAGRALRDPAATPAERVCSHTVELLVRATGHSDDITLLAAQRVPLPPALTLDLPADPTVLQETRAKIQAWLYAVGATATDTFAVQHALGEFLANAMEHASTPYAIEVRGVLGAAGQVEISVRDRGAWREPTPQPNRGRGLALAAQLVETVQVEPSAKGTIARLRHTLVRPARLLSERGPSSEMSHLFTIVEEPGGDETRVRIEGDIDAVTAERVRTELLRRSRGGTVPLHVDLSAVTHLASAGVSALHHVAAQHAEQKAALELHAADGTPVRVILDLVGLPGLSTGRDRMSAGPSTIAG